MGYEVKDNSDNTKEVVFYCRHDERDTLTIDYVDPLGFRFAIGGKAVLIERSDEAVLADLIAKRELPNKYDLRFGDLVMYNGRHVKVVNDGSGGVLLVDSRKFKVLAGYKNLAEAAEVVS